MKSILTQLSTIELVGFSTLALSLMVQIYYYFRYFYRIVYAKQSTEESIGTQVPVTVVICAKDEFSNLENNLPLILNQDYPNFQVVLVDDCSEDETEDYLKQIGSRYPHLYVTRINPDPIFKHGKKLALTIGIKAAKYDHLLLCDADCTPSSQHWIREMASLFSKETDIILGYSPVKKEKGWLNHFLRYENLFTAIQYLGFALAKKPYMGVGRNLAYKKDLFFKYKGFASHAHLLSGDDDLFVNQAATSHNTKVNLSKDSAMLTMAPTSWKSYKTQRRRHLTTGKLYKSGDKFRLGSELVSRLLFWLSCALIIVASSYWYIGLSAFVFRFAIQWFCINLSARKLGQTMFPISILFYDILSPAINGLFSLSNMLNPKSVKWK